MHLSSQDKTRLLVAALIEIFAGFVVAVWSNIHSEADQPGFYVVKYVQVAHGVVYLLLAVVSLSLLYTSACARCCRPRRRSDAVPRRKSDLVQGGDIQDIIFTGRQVETLIEVNSHLLIIASMVGFLLQFYLNPRNAGSSRVNFTTLICPALAVVLCKFWWGSILWSAVTGIVIVFGGLVYEIFDEGAISQQLLVACYPAGRTKTVVSDYICSVLPFFFGLVAFLYVHFMRDSEQRLTLKVAKAISQLKFDDASIQKLKNKPLKNCSETEMVLRETLRNMIMYAKYLPENLKVQQADGKDDDDDDSNPSMITASSSGSSQAISDSSSIRSYTGPEMKAVAEASRRKQEQQLKNLAAFRVGLMARRAGSILVADVRSMHALLSAEDDSSVIVRQFNEFVDCFARVVKKTGGVVEGIQGDKCIATWNSIRNCVTHQKNAVVCACELLAGLEGRSAGSSFHVVFCLCAGEMLQGNAGTEVKRNVTLGWPCSLVYGMKKCIAVGFTPPKASSEGIGTPQSSSVIYIDESIRKHVKWAFATRIVAVVEHQGRKTQLYRLGKRLFEEGQGKEWMYTLAGQLQKREEEEGEAADEVEASKSPHQTARTDFDEAWKELWAGIARGDPDGSLAALSKKLDGLCRTPRDASDAAIIHKLLESGRWKCMRDW